MLHNNKGAHSEDEEDWMISYADMVTLLLCFFVLFFSPDKKKDKEAEKVQENNVANMLAESFSPTNKAPASVGGPMSDEKMMTEIKNNLNKKLQTLDKTQIDYELDKLNATEILLRVWNQGMFTSGSSILSSTGHDLVTRVAGSLSGFSGKIEIRIEGHTDSRNMRVGSKIKNNLVLSSLRAASTASVFLEENNTFNEKDITLIGSGSKRLLLPDVDDKNNFINSAADKNRRIDIYIISKGIKKEKTAEDAAATGKDASKDAAHGADAHAGHGAESKTEVKTETKPAAKPAGHH